MALSSASTRIQIQRSSSSSSDDSNGSDEIVTKRTRQRRKKTTTTNERSSILKQIKRQTEERKNSSATTDTTTIIPDKNNNTKHNESNSKKCSFQFSDEDDDPAPATTNQTNRKIDEDDGGTTESYDAENDDQEKKNGQIKTEHEEEDEQGENSSNKRNSQNGRKNIRKIIDDQKLDIQTKHAVEAELERRRRIAEKQKEYNDNLLEKSSYLSNLENEQLNNPNLRLILELDPTTNEPLIEVSPKLVRQLKPHQCDGIRFLWNNVFESIDAIQNKKEQGSGCILAHCMGLGKTLQVISFIHTIFNYDQITKVRTCLVLCPINAGK